VFPEGAHAEAAAAGGEPCGGDDVDPSADNVHAVPAEYDTIQEAVDAAVPCDMVLVSPGVYNEAVDVTTDDITIRGLDRNQVILDGEFELDNGIRVLEADGVAIENMTARNYTTNGFFWTGVERYRGSYLTAHNLGSYGIYAFDSTVGLIEHSYGSGASDGGVYIGQCNPCDAVVDNMLSEHNGLGYSGTNASGDLYIVNSTFRYNRTGLAPNSGLYEEYWPQGSATIVGNIIHGNVDDDSTPAIPAAQRAGGTGIIVAGGNDNLIERNLLYDNDIAGVVIVLIDDDTLVEDEDDEDYLFWPEDNVVRGNVVEGSGSADLVLADEFTLQTLDLVVDLFGMEGGAGQTNCFADNTFGTSDPVDIETVAACDDATGEPEDVGALFDLLYFAEGERPEPADYQDMPAPEPQETMPDADSAPWRSAGGPPEVDVEAIAVPARSDDEDDAGDE
jgi:hypothetical protein